MDKNKLKEFNRLTESFIKEVEKMDLNEGWMDTAKASTAGTKGAFQGFGKQLKGHFNKAVGNLANKGINYLAKGVGADPSKSTWAKSAQNLATQGQSQIDTGKQMGYNAKYTTYVKNTVNTLIDDLVKLNIPIKDKNKLMGDVTKSIVTNTKAPSTATTAPKTAPVPQSKPAATPMAAPVSQPASAAPQKMAVAPQKSMAVPQSTTGKMVGSKGLPSSLSKLKQGQFMSANARQAVSPEAPPVVSNVKPNVPKAEEPKSNPKPSVDKQKQYARDKVKAQLQGKKAA